MYVDAFRLLHPQKEEFTFYRASCAPSRLDRVYVPTHITGHLVSAAHQPSLADHWGVFVEMKLDIGRLDMPPRPPKTHWKLNSTILQHEAFLPQFRRLFLELEEEVGEFEDIAEWWDVYAKPAITTFCQSFSQSLAKQRKVFKTFLKALICIATRKNDWALVTQTKEKLQTIITYEAYGLIIRSRDKQNTEEEAASLYHLGKASKSCMKKMKVPEDGQVGFRKKH